MTKSKCHHRCFALATGKQGCCSHFGGFVPLTSGSTGSRLGQHLPEKGRAEGVHRDDRTPLERLKRAGAPRNQLPLRPPPLPLGRGDRTPGLGRRGPGIRSLELVRRMDARLVLRLAPMHCIRCPSAQNAEDAFVCFSSRPGVVSVARGDACYGSHSCRQPALQACRWLCQRSGATTAGPAEKGHALVV